MAVKQQQQQQPIPLVILYYTQGLTLFSCFSVIVKRSKVLVDFICLCLFILENTLEAVYNEVGKETIAEILSVVVLLYI